MMEVAGQIEVHNAIFTWCPARPSESPECSSCSTDNEQSVLKRMRGENKFSSSFFCVLSLGALLYVNPLVFLLFWLVENLRGPWIFAFYSVIFRRSVAYCLE